MAVPLLLSDPAVVRSSGSDGMTTSNRFDDIVTSTESFEAVMRDVILAAVRNDVNPRGSWVYRNGGVAPDLEVLVTELEKRDNQ